MQARSLIIAVSIALTAPAMAHGDAHKKVDAPKTTAAAPAAAAAAAATTTAPATASAAGMTDGEIRKVDKDAKKITIKHGAMQNLEMPPMTMVFQVKDPAMLDSVKAGDKVNFTAEKIGGQFTVTRIEAAK